MAFLVTPFLGLLITVPVFCYIAMQKDRKVKELLVIAYILRVLIVLADTNQWFHVPLTGADDEGMHRYAAANQYLKETLHLTNYTTVLTFIYSITGTSRAFAQYFNVILGIGVLAFLNESLKLLGIDIKTLRSVLTLAVYMPMLVILSGILLREAWCQMFLMMSLYYFLRWFVGRGGQLSVVISLACVFGASWMHGGCVAVAVGYFMGFLFYNPRTKTNSFSYRSVIAAILLIAFVMIFTANMNILGSKFSKYAEMESEEVFILRANAKSDAGSQYLMWLPQVENPLIGLLYSPLKIFYFLFSPIPFDWRSIKDFQSFILDSIIYIYLLWKLFKTKVTQKWAVHLRNYMFAIFFIITFVFSYGTNVAGTAIRHRSKSVAILFVAYAVTKTVNREEENTSKNKLG